MENDKIGEKSKMSENKEGKDETNRAVDIESELLQGIADRCI